MRRWAAHSEAASAGKPLWLTLDDDAVHHLFFDDNLNNDPQSSIVATRVRDSAAAPFRPAPGAATRALHGVCVCKCPTFEAVLDPQWFLRQIDAAERTHASAPPVRMLPWLVVYAA